MGAHRIVVTALALAVVVLGAIMLVSTLVRGGGPLATGVVFGILFILGGSLRLYLIRSGG
jgi:hypothetical protein